MARRRISQREAIATRKELNAVRDFLWKLRHAAGNGRIEVGRVPICDLSRGRIQGARAMAPSAVLVCYIDGNEIVCQAHVPPEVAS